MIRSVFADSQRQLAIGEAGAQSRADGHVLCRTQHLAAGVEHDRVTAFQRGQRAHRVQRVAGVAQVGLPAFEQVGHRAAQALVLLGKASRQQRQAGARVLRQQARLQALQPGMAQLTLFAQHGAEAALQVLQSFVVACQSRLRPLRLQPGQQVVDALRMRLQLALLQGRQALSQLLQVTVDRNRVGYQ